MLTKLVLIVTTRCDYHCAHCLRGLLGAEVFNDLGRRPHLPRPVTPY